MKKSVLFVIILGTLLSALFIWLVHSRVKKRFPDMTLDKTETTQNISSDSFLKNIKNYWTEIQENKASIEKRKKEWREEAQEMESELDSIELYGTAYYSPVRGTQNRVIRKVRINLSGLSRTLNRDRFYSYLTDVIREHNLELNSYPKISKFIDRYEGNQNLNNKEVDETAKEIL
ncbi:MAG: hypothetical protein FWD54_06150 [Endomicrobia bacterium]|nr:hypothetical protein [Endomicrobiia bacterium]